MKEIKYLYGIDANGKVIHISETTETGLQCNCTCVLCHEPLIAKKGNVREYHFAHIAESTCKISNDEARESYLHQIAKEIIRESNHIEIPAFS